MSLSQNLVPNGSFECGEDFCGAFQGEQSALLYKYACQWSVPNTGTTDIYSARFPPDRLCLFMGKQAPRTGNRFAGIYTYSHESRPGQTSYREYVQIKLEEPLKPGNKYCAEAYASLAEGVYYASNNFGMRFNVKEHYSGSFAPLKLVPQLIEKKIIKDTSNWVKISGMVEVDSVSQYLILGNFADDEHTDRDSLTAQHRWFAYYFIDDVSVEALPLDQFTFSGNTIICTGDSTELVASVGAQVKWTTLEDTSTVVHVGEKFKIKPSSSTTFRVSSNGCNKRVVDTITVKVNPRPIVDLGGDTTLCKGQTKTLDAGAGFLSYQWQDRSVGQTFEVSEAGTYHVEMSNGYNCTYRDEIKISYDDVPKIELGRDTLVCEGYYPIEAGGKEYSYLWSTGSVESTLIPLQSGTYWVEASNHCGAVKDSINLYSVNNIFIPNVITVNDDLLNEQLKIGVKDMRGHINTSLGISSGLRIYDRWGLEVYSQNPYSNNWPQNNYDVEGGSYYYFVSVPGCKDFKGWIQVIR